MRTHKHAELPENDSIVYMLIHMNWCIPTLAERKFRIGYYRNEDANEETGHPTRDIAFDDVEAAHPGLCDVLLSMFPETSSVGTQQTVTANIIASFVFGSYVDLRLGGPAATEYPYVAKVMGVSTSESAGSFDIACTAFDVLEVSDKGIPKIKHRSYLVQSVNAEQIDSIWPNSSTIIPVMETLGYTRYEICGELNRGLTNPGSAVACAVPDFEPSVD